MESLKERLAKRADLTNKEIECYGEKFKIRRLTVSERDNILKGNESNKNGAGEYERGALMSRKVVEVGLVEPKTTFEELGELPAVIVEGIAKEIMDFNGWSVDGQKALGDQFRPPA